MGDLASPAGYTAALKGRKERERERGEKAIEREIKEGRMNGG